MCHHTAYAGPSKVDDNFNLARSILVIQANTQLTNRISGGIICRPLALSMKGV